VVLVEGEEAVEHLIHPLVDAERAERIAGHGSGSLTDLLLSKKVRRFKIRPEAVSVVAVGFRAKDVDERLQWTRTIQSLSPSDVYVNTVHF
jgi:hypothetical protein